MRDRATAKLRAFVERRHRRLMWGQPHWVKPRLVSAIFGDGKVLLLLTPIMTRPNYFVVRIDSEWHLDKDGGGLCEHLPEIQESIEDQFGYYMEEDAKADRPQRFPDRIDSGLPT